MTQDARTRWLPVTTGIVALVPAGFVAGLVLFSACFALGDFGDTSTRAQVCNAGDGSAVILVPAIPAVLAFWPLVAAVRRGATGLRPWLLAALPALSLVVGALLIGLLPVR